MNAPVRAHARVLPARARGARSRAFTLIELIVYVALVTGGLSVLLGLELAASRAWFLEHALIDLALRGDDLGTRFRDDVREGTVVTLPALPTALSGAKVQAPLLMVTLPTGQVVRYDLEEATRIEPSSDAEHHVSGVKGTGGRLVRTLLAKGASESQDRIIWTGVEHLEIDQLSIARGSVETRGFDLDVTLVVRRGGDVTARRRFHAWSSPLAEETP